MKNTVKKSFLLLFTSFIAVAAHAQLINTVAGNGTPGFSGDGGPAAAAQLNYPYAVAVDTAGNIYFSDQQNQRIRKIWKKSIDSITTIVGNGTQGFAGDGTDTAVLNTPEGLVIDNIGFIYFADKYNHRVRYVSTLGIVQTVFGTGTPGYTGNGGPASLATLNQPSDIVQDAAGNFYIADYFNNVIRKVDGTTGIITTYAGNGFGAGLSSGGGYLGDNGAATSAKLYWPSGLALDKAGNLYIADQWNNVIRKVDAITGIITTVAGNGFGAGLGTGGYAGDNYLAINAQLYHPTKVAVDSIGNLYITDAGNHRIRRVDHTSKYITTVAGTGVTPFNGDNIPAVNADLFTPTGIAIEPSGKMYIADNGHFRIRTFTIPALSVTPPVCYGSDIRMYPNPATDNIHISVLSTADQINIFDMSGRKVSFTQSMDSDGVTATVDVHALPAGSYLLNVVDALGVPKANATFIKK